MATKPDSTILKHVIVYFVRAFPNTPPEAFKASTKVRVAFDDRAWMNLADDFNDMAWMKQMDVRISQQEMGDADVQTIGDVALLITEKAGKRAGELSGNEFPRPKRVNLVDLQ